MADQGVEFAVAEAALAHTVGNAVVAAYQRARCSTPPRNGRGYVLPGGCRQRGRASQGRGVIYAA